MGTKLCFVGNAATVSRPSHSRGTTVPWESAVRATGVTRLTDGHPLPLWTYVHIPHERTSTPPMNVHPDRCSRTSYLAHAYELYGWTLSQICARTNRIATKIFLRAHGKLSAWPRKNETTARASLFQKPFHLDAFPILF